MARSPTPEALSVSRELERWLESDAEKTLGGLVELFEEKSFAILFVVLLGVPALPLPTGGATHVFEVIAILLALQLIAGREHIWLPERWRRLELAGPRQQRFVAGLMKFIRRLERFSRPRLTFLFDHRLSNIVFGLLVIAGVRRRLPRSAVHGARHAAGARRRPAVARGAARGLPRRGAGLAVGVAGVVPGDRAGQGRGQGHRQPVLSTPLLGIRW